MSFALKRERGREEGREREGEGEEGLAKNLNANIFFSHLKNCWLKPRIIGDVSRYMCAEKLLICIKIMQRKTPTVLRQRSNNFQSL